jgi:hypothetical protein
MYARLGDRCWYGMKRYPSRPRTSKMLYRFTMLAICGRPDISSRAAVESWDERASSRDICTYHTLL